MNVLHTSDWHLGRHLYGRKRHDEFEAFLQWLLQTIAAENIDVLLVAGDVFDTTTPSNRAQNMYYEFLCAAAQSCCRHVVVIGGNHDSPTFLEAPKSLLKHLDVHVVGAKAEEIQDEVIVLKNQNQAEAIICAVPYLRDKDLRQVEAGETAEDKNTKLYEGLKFHYAAVCGLAEAKQQAFKETDGVKVPIIGMGHLFAAGGVTVDGDGVRELYVGNLAHVGTEVFPPCLDYVALGHLHVPQVVGDQQHIRYCGSPIPMGFGEAKQQKLVLKIQFNNSVSAQDQGMTVDAIAVPTFQALKRISGDLDDILSDCMALKSQESDAWIEVEYTGQAIVSRLKAQIDEAIEGSQIEVLRIKNKRVMDRVLNQAVVEETLDDLHVNDVFQQCLTAHEVPEKDQEGLQMAFNEITRQIQESDVNAE